MPRNDYPYEWEAKQRIDLTAVFNAARLQALFEREVFEARMREMFKHGANQ